MYWLALLFVVETLFSNIQLINNGKINKPVVSKLLSINILKSLAICHILIVLGFSKYVLLSYAVTEDNFLSGIMNIIGIFIQLPAPIVVHIEEVNKDSHSQNEISNFVFILLIAEVFLRYSHF